MVAKQFTRKHSVSKSILALALAASTLGSAMVVESGYACGSDPYIGSVCIVAYVRGCPAGFVPANGQLLAVNSYQALFSLYGTNFGGDGRTTFGVPDLRGRAVVGAGTYSAIPSGTSTTVTLGQKRGADTVALTANNIPVHTHAATFTATTAPQTITIPGQTASGSISATATTDIVPGSTGSIDPLPNVTNYYLTGVAGGTAGPVTLTVPGTDKSTLIGTKVVVDSSTYKPAIAPQTVSVNTVSGGAVAVAPTTSTNAPVATVPPELGLYYCIATEGLYPQFP